MPTSVQVPFYWDLVLLWCLVILPPQVHLPMTKRVLLLRHPIQRIAKLGMPDQRLAVLVQKKECCRPLSTATAETEKEEEPERHVLL
jgi:hypothetical protein